MLSTDVWSVDAFLRFRSINKSQLICTPYVFLFSQVKGLSSSSLCLKKLMSSSYFAIRLLFFNVLLYSLLAFLCFVYGLFSYNIVFLQRSTVFYDSFELYNLFMAMSEIHNVPCVSLHLSPFFLYLKNLFFSYLSS